MLIGYKHTAKTKAKMSEAALVRDNGPRLEALPKKEKHWNWQKTPSKTALHKRLHR